MMKLNNTKSEWFMYKVTENMNYLRNFLHFRLIYRFSAML